MPGEWGDTAELYEGSFGRLCAGSVASVLDAVTAELGGATASLVDVGTGPGTLARAAASRGFAAYGCDPESSMVALARLRSTDIDYQVAGLPNLPYPDRAFTAVCANFVVNHTHRPKDAVVELARVSDGVVAVTIWPRVRTVLNGLWSGVVRDSAAVTAPGTVVPPEADFERTEAGLTDLLAGAGLTEPWASTLDWDFAIAADELWPAIEAGVGTIGTTYLAQNQDARDRMRSAYWARSAALVASDGLMHFPTLALLGVARRAVR
jgi:SAM-dependent methyltransferase